MKFLKFIRPFLSEKQFCDLLGSRYCRKIRVRLISRSFDSSEIYLCFKLLDVVQKAFLFTTSTNEIQRIFKMDKYVAIDFFGARWGGAWWSFDNPNRQKYMTYLFFQQ